MADTGLVVVVGAGIGGLAVAVALNKVRYDASAFAYGCMHMSGPLPRLGVVKPLKRIQP